MGIKEIKGGFRNCTDPPRHIPKNIRILLSLGDKFIIPHRKYTNEDILDMIEDLENIWHTTPVWEKSRNLEKFKNELINDMLEDRTNPGKKERKIIKAVNDLEKFMKENKDLCIKQADKGNQTIIMEKAIFKELANTFLEKALNNKLYTFEEVASENTIEIIALREMARLRRKVSIWKQGGLFIQRNEKNVSLEQTYWSHITNVDSHIPNMLFVIKTHKEEGLAIRNICPKNKTWTQHLSQIITDIIEDALKDNLRKINYINTNIDNIEKFAEEIQGQTIQEDEEINSVDIKEMYNKIDQNSLIDIIRRYIDNQTYNRETLIDMIKYDIQGANWATYNKRIYKQTQGIPMGASTSSVYAKIYLDYYISLNWKDLKKAGLTHMYKYVDDLLIINKKGKLSQITDILNKETKLEHKTVKKEKEETEFLDMLININQGAIQTRKYKKPYMSNRTINANSTQSWHTKNATITNRFHRSIKLTSTEHLYNVLQLDIEVILNNGYNLMRTEKLLKIAHNKFKETTNNTTKEALKKHRLNKLKIIEECLHTIQIQKNQTKRKISRIHGTIQEPQTNAEPKPKGRTHKTISKTIKSKKAARKRHIAKHKNKGKANKSYIRTPFKGETSLKRIKSNVRNILNTNQNYAIRNNTIWNIKEILRTNSINNKNKNKNQP